MCCRLMSVTKRWNGKFVVLRLLLKLTGGCPMVCRCTEVLFVFEGWAREAAEPRDDVASRGWTIITRAKRSTSGTGELWNQRSIGIAGIAAGVTRSGPHPGVSRLHLFRLFECLLWWWFGWIAVDGHLITKYFVDIYTDLLYSHTGYDVTTSGRQWLPETV